MANKLTENLPKIWIYEQILVTGHPDVDLDGHLDHVFLKQSWFSGKQKWNWKFWHMGFMQNRPISITMGNFSKIQIHLGENHGSLKPTFLEIMVGHFLNLETSCNSSGNWGIWLYPSPLGCSCINYTLEVWRWGFYCTNLFLIILNCCFWFKFIFMRWWLVSLWMWGHCDLRGPLSDKCALLCV